MKEKVAVILGMIAIAGISALITAGIMECNHDRMDLKQQMATPTSQWTDKHGDSIDSAQTYSIAVLLDAERKRQNAATK